MRKFNWGFLVRENKKKMQLRNYDNFKGYIRIKAVTLIWWKIHL